MPSRLVETAGLDRILVRLGRLRPKQADWNRLGAALEKLIVEDNRRGVLSGQDCTGAPMAPVKYRTGVTLKTRFRRTRELDVAGRSVFGTRWKRFKGKTTYQNKASGILPNNNLSSTQYKKLSGPPLAPRGEASRVITNLETAHRIEDGKLVVEGSWNSVLDANGKPFLHDHFVGSGRLPRRDLRGVRPHGLRMARAIARQWLNELAKGTP